MSSWIFRRPKLATGFIAVALIGTLIVSGAFLTRSDGTAESSSTPAPVAPPSPAFEPLTPKVAAQAYQAFLANDQVARASRDERLALSWASDAQASLTAAEFRKAIETRRPIPQYQYGKPTLYVPRLRQDPREPQWFVAVVSRSTQGVKGKRTAVLAFRREKPGERLELSLCTLLEKDAKLPKISVDAEGYASPLATFDKGIVIPPRSVPAMQATLAEEGEGSPAARVMRPGKYTSGYRTQDEAAARKLRKRGILRNTIYAATGTEFFSLRTTNGNAVVFYALSRSTKLIRKDKKGPPVSAPENVRYLVDPQAKRRREFDIIEMIQFGATVPAVPKDKNTPPGRADIIAVDGGLTKALYPKPS